MIDDRTHHLNLPLPHPSNELNEDAPRLRAALTGVDDAVADVTKTLAQKADAAAVDAALADKADADAVDAALADKADADAVATELAQKADVADLLALEARTVAGLDLKADANAVDAALALKADDASVTTALEKKADISALKLKADATAVDAALAQKADRATTVAASITTAWTGTAPPYTQTVSVAGVMASSIVEVTLPATATQEHLEAFRALNWTDGGQTAGKITLKAWGTKNTTAIPITVIIRG